MIIINENLMFFFINDDQQTAQLLTCSQDQERCAPSDKWRPSQHSIPCWHNTLLRQSDDHVIIFQYDHNAASCLDVWQTGPRISMLKKENQREKK